jgi:hypothetical protein
LNDNIVFIFDLGQLETLIQLIIDDVSQSAVAVVSLPHTPLDFESSTTAFLC